MRCERLVEELSPRRKLASYVEAVKQVEILFALGGGTLVFGEARKVREIAPGALVMLAGMVLLSLAG